MVFDKGVWHIEHMYVTPEGRMAQNSRTRGELFHVELDRGKESQGCSTTCSK